MLDSLQPIFAAGAPEGLPPPANLLMVYLLLGLAGLGVDAALLFGSRVTMRGWREGVERMKSRPILPMDGLLMLGLSLLAIGLIAGGSWLWGVGAGEGDEGDPAWGFLLSSLVVHWGGIAMVLVWLRLRRLRFESVFARPGRHPLADFGLGAVLYLGLIPLLVAYAVVYEFISRLVGHQITPQDLVGLIRGIESPWMLLYFSVLVALIGPLAEELTFRGIALPLLARRFGTGPALLMLSGAFVLLHGNFDAMGPLMIVALGFALAALYTGSIWVAVGMHAAFNGVNLGVLLLARSLGEAL